MRWRCLHKIMLHDEADAQITELFLCLSITAIFLVAVLYFFSQPASQHAIFSFARVPQIWENFKNKSTGELSFWTCFMNFGGSTVRAFTSTEQKAPASVILLSGIGILMNGTILSQIIIYQKPQVQKGKKAK